MKTIREVVGQSVGGPLPEFVVRTLEARERERDYAERERVRKAIALGFKVRFGAPTKDFLMEYIYQPPEPEKLPAGYWWVRRNEPDHDWVGKNYSFEFVPSSGFEYRRWDDPPPEVTGKVEQQLPTAQEWIEENVVGWDEPDMFWYKSSAFPKSPSRNVPDEIFDKLKSPFVGEPPMAVYHSHDEALANLKRVLIEMGLAR